MNETDDVSKVNKETILPLIKKMGEDHDIDPKWIEAIIEHESHWDPYAVRYEPHYSNLFQETEFCKISHVTLKTEIHTQKISWGLGQIMGGLARAQGYRRPLPSLIAPEYNILQMCILIQSLKKISSDFDDILAMYNGGPRARHRIHGKYPNQDYVDQVKKYFI